MHRRTFFLRVGSVSVLAAAFPAVVSAQRRLWRIGYFTGGSPQSNAGWLDAFWRGMSELGRSEARDYVIDARYAGGVVEQFRSLAAELVGTQPDVLLTTAGPATKLLLEYTNKIPIVFTIIADPVSEKLVANLHRPGGNVTGLTTLTGDLAPKRLQLLKDAFPKVSHVAVLFQGDDENSFIQVKQYEPAAKGLKMRLTALDVRRPADIDPAPNSGAAAGADAYAIAAGFMINVHGESIAARIVQARAPSVGSSEILAQSGILMAYAPSTPENFRRAATYVDKILKGTKPGDLPIEQPTKFDFVVNARTAKALGMTLAPSLLVQADRVIQ